MKIQIVGSGCGRCQATEAKVRQAVSDLQIDADISHCYDLKEFPKLGVRITPAVVIDGKNIISGRVPSVDELKVILQR